MNIGGAVLIAFLMTRPATPPAPYAASTASMTGLPSRVVRDAMKLTGRAPLLALLIGGASAAAVHPADTSVERGIPKFGTVDEALDAGSALGDGWVQWTTAGVVYGAGLVLRKPTVADVGSRLVEAQIVAGVTTQLIKYAVNRQRPDGGRLSFPSGHSEASFATADILEQHYGWRIGALAYAAAGAVSVSRLAEHQHYLSDVIFGAAIGVAGARATAAAHGGHRSAVLAGFRIVPVVTRGGAGVFVTHVGMADAR